MIGCSVNDVVFFAVIDINERLLTWLSKISQCWGRPACKHSCDYDVGLWIIKTCKSFENVAELSTVLYKQHCTQTYGGVEVQYREFLISALDRAERLEPCHDLFILRDEKLVAPG
jgi:hypothetical protein